VRYLILSDIHSNWEALDAVMRDAAGAYDEILCCGDLIGYGADPNLVVEWVREHCAAVVRGNHDKACTGLDDLEWFNPVAREAALWTKRVLTPENAAYARALAKGPLILNEFQLVHGSAFDEDEYVLAPGEAELAFTYMETRIEFFGHTHVQGGFIWNRSRVEILPRVAPKSPDLEMEIDPGCAYMINPGSVGQPRDGDPRAAFVIYNTDSAAISYRRVEYDLAGAQKKIREAGLPQILADRLAAGR
jgi:diadenosine tetraphosphatase ApaH/serine/threonine PP2A family protein phosphatase